MRGDQAAALGAAMDGDEFADAVAVADARFGALALVFQILRGHARRCCTGKRRCLRRSRWGLPGKRGPSAACRRRFPLPPDDRNTDRFRRSRRCAPRVEQSRWDESASIRTAFPLPSLSASLHITSASATTRPSTVAMPAILATLALRLRIFISMRRVSPGTTGRRKLGAGRWPASSTSLLWRSATCFSTSTPAVCARLPRSARPASPENRENGPERRVRCA